MRVTVRKMERIMLGVYLKDRKKNTWIRQKTGVTDIGEKHVTVKAFAWFTNKIGALRVHTRIPGS
jgi:hypothetical protein